MTKPVIAREIMTLVFDVSTIMFMLAKTSAAMVLESSWYSTAAATLRAAGSGCPVPSRRRPALTPLLCRACMALPSLLWELTPPCESARLGAVALSPATAPAGMRMDMEPSALTTNWLLASCTVAPDLVVMTAFPPTTESLAS